MKKFNVSFLLLAMTFSLIPLPLTAAEPTPPELQGVGITEHLGENIDLDLTFVNEAGNEVPLRQFFVGKHPVILSLAYYGCPNLCQFLLNGITDGIKGLAWTVGQEYVMVNVSIDHREGAELAGKKKTSHIQAYGRSEGAQGWHFLTGSQDSIKKLADQVGYGFRYDADQDQYAHASAVMILTPEGKIARYLYGIEFPPRDLKLALLEATDGKVGSVVDRLLLFCYRYDPKGRKYSLFAQNLMKGAGAVTVVALGGFLVPFAYRHRRKGHQS